MKFHTHQLAQGPVDLPIKCTPAEIALNDTDVRFVGDVTGSMRFTQVDSGRVLMQGTFEAMLQFDCVRCLEVAMTTTQGEITAIYEAVKKDKVAEIDPFDDPADHAMVTFNGDTLDPSPQIREAVMLGVPEFPICRPDCKGLCLTCGANKNLGPCRCDGTLKELPAWKSKLQGLRLNEGGSGQ
jgi:uncharacterized protein